MAVQIPVGYTLVTEESEDEGVGKLYAFKRPDGTHTMQAWSWKMGCIDAMWEDVRNRATQAAVPAMSATERSLRSNASFAIGYLQGKTFVDAEVRIRMALRVRVRSWDKRHRDRRKAIGYVEWQTLGSKSLVP